VIVTTSAVVVLGCGAVVWGGVGLGCGVGFWMGVWEVEVGVELVVVLTLDVVGGVGVTVVPGVVEVVGGVVDTTGTGVVDTKQRRKYGQQSIDEIIE
jgi:hypothetical protein